MQGNNLLKKVMEKQQNKGSQKGLNLLLQIKT
jgi:hypothetical protein